MEADCIGIIIVPCVAPVCRQAGSSGFYSLLSILEYFKCYSNII